MNANVSNSGGSNDALPSRGRTRAASIGARRDGVAEPAGGELERRGHVLDLDLRLEHDARALGALAQLAADRVHARPAGVEQDQRRGGEPLDRHRLAHALGSADR